MFLKNVMLCTYIETMNCKRHSVRIILTLYEKKNVTLDDFSFNMKHI